MSIKDFIRKLFPKETERRDKKQCPSCETQIDLNAHPFKDALSLKEFYISGLCQNCQDKTFVDDAAEAVSDPFFPLSFQDDDVHPYIFPKDDDAPF